MPNLCFEIKGLKNYLLSSKELDILFAEVYVYYSNFFDQLRPSHNCNVVPINYRKKALIRGCPITLY